jgi:glycine/D-amino acid oxidase-like deaminating enzyme
MAPRSGKTPVWPAGPPGKEDRASYAEAEPRPFWLDRERPEPFDPLEGKAGADLVVVGGGLTGLWAAIRAKEQDPGRAVTLIEKDTLAEGASGRNGGFMSSSLVHGLGNGLSRFPEEMATLEKLGLENLEAIGESIDRYGIDCDLEKNGAIETAMNDSQFEALAGEADEFARFGHEAVLLDREAMQAEVASPLFTGGLWQKTGEWAVDPVKLCDGLARAAADLGVVIFENTGMTGLRKTQAGVDVLTSGGSIAAGKALLATAAFSSPVRAVSSRVIPVYDYVLVSEPLDDAQKKAIGWDNRQGLSDSANRFHYYRQTADGRILWGGYDAIYNFGGKVDPRHYQRDRSFAGLAQRFHAAFPQLRGIRFTHRWGGAIDTCSRFFAFYGLTHGGRVSYAVGHTGLGVGASRFAAGVALELLESEGDPASRRDPARAGVLDLQYVRERPIPFPPEPVRWPVIQFTRNRIAAADMNGGRDGFWLRTLSRLGLGFDS